MKKGYFGIYGGSFVSSEIQQELDIVEKEYLKIKKDKDFIKELNNLRRDFQGRPTPLYFCKNLTEKIGGAKIYLKREDLNHTGAHKINHAIGECLLAKRLGKTKIIAETGAGQHGVSIATACTMLGLKCEIHMGVVDIEKQRANVEKMKMLGAKIIECSQGDGTLKDAVDSALLSYYKQYKTSLYCIGSVVGPHPFPTMVRDFQSVIGKETKKQFKKAENKNPDYIVACVGGGSNAIGIFYPFIKEKEVKLIGVEALGRGENIGDNSCTIKFGEVGVYQGFKSKVLKDKNGNISDAYSIASGLDYPGVGPEHAYLDEIKRVKYEAVGDAEVLNAFYMLTKEEGIIPALESSHALAYAIKIAKTLDKEKSIVVNLSGRGDKDIDFILSLKGENKNEK
ncbi:MAG: tryptophan synthase subunit beta [Clostridia bacterium]|nr:tryptophan synthase subunit beta [Clostridia bacterium]